MEDELQALVEIRVVEVIVVEELVLLDSAGVTSTRGRDGTVDPAAEDMETEEEHGCLWRHDALWLGSLRNFSSLLFSLVNL